jgi:hypothetical protein
MDNGRVTESSGSDTVSMLGGGVDTTSATAGGLDVGAGIEDHLPAALGRGVDA